jgi:hypothetical protein
MKRIKVPTSSNDPTVSRLLGIAQSICTECRGVEHYPHTPAGYTVTGMRGYVALRPDCAIAWFGLTRGSVVVRINGQPFWAWWWPTLDAGEAHYAEVRKALFVLADNPQGMYDRVRHEGGLNPDTPKPSPSPTQVTKETN